VTGEKRTNDAMSFTVPKDLEAELDEVATHYPQSGARR